MYLELSNALLHVLLLYCRFLVGVVASNGVLDGPAATKGAHFIRMCSIRGTPLIFLQNTPSDWHFLSPAACDDPITLKARGQMMATLSCSKVSGERGRERERESSK